MFQLYHFIQTLSHFIYFSYHDQIKFEGNDGVLCHYYCAQDALHHHQPQKYAFKAKQYDKMSMPSFDCHSLLRIVLCDANSGRGFSIFIL